MPLREKFLIISRLTGGITPFLLLLGLAFVYFSAVPASLNAQSQAPSQDVSIVKGGVDVDPNAGPFSPSDQPEPPVQIDTGGAGAGLTITPTFDPSIDAATQIVINNAINFYQSTFTDPINVHIYFYNMGNGLGSSYFGCYTVAYSTFRAAMATHSANSYDTTALANTASGPTNPVNGGSSLCVKPANGLALGLNTPEFLHNFQGSPCPTFTGSGCIGINVALANSIGDLPSVVEHEIDEILGLGSALNGTTTPSTPWPEDLFRWASAGTRSYAANSSTSNPCTSTPSVFFSIDGGATNLNQFNNCNNGGDYGDWITHTPSQVQDAFTNGTGSASLSKTSSEVRALDVIGYTVLPKKVRGQVTSF